MDPEKLRQALYDAHDGRADRRRVQAIINTLLDPDKKNDLDPDLNERELQAVAGQMGGPQTTDCPLCGETADNLPDHLLDDH